MIPCLVGTHPTVVALRVQITRIAATSYPVLVIGETGTGKAVVAAMLHAESLWRTGPLVIASCAALPPDLFAAQMFGAVKGAYTGAVGDQEGLFAAADGGTLVLDDVALLSGDLQALLLRVLDTGEVRRLGDAAPRRVSVRVVATTNESPRMLIAHKRMREDFYFRLAAMELTIPPLRDRVEDILPLMTTHLVDINAERATPITLSLEAHALCLRYSWPGNVRELFHALDAASVRCEGDTMLPCHLPLTVHRGFVVSDIPEPSLDITPFCLSRALREVEAHLLAEALSRTKGVTAAAARMLGIKRTTLVQKLQVFRQRGWLAAVPKTWRAPPRSLLPDPE